MAYEAKEHLIVSCYPLSGNTTTTSLRCFRNGPRQTHLGQMTIQLSSVYRGNDRLNSRDKLVGIPDNDSGLTLLEFKHLTAVTDGSRCVTFSVPRVVLA